MNDSTLKPGDTLGLIGGGQLGRMFTQAAQRMGFQVAVIDPDRHCPAAQVGAIPITGRWDDRQTLEKLAQISKATTVEFENIPARALFYLEKIGVACRPGWRGLWVSQNRIREKRFLERLGCPLPFWCEIRSESDLDRAARTVGLPLILKTAAEGYDGKGQARVESASQLADAWNSMGQRPCVAESLVQFQAELSIIAGRDQFGAIACHGPMWNHHTHHILDWSIYPSPFGPIITTEAVKIARRVVESLGHVGLMTVELFLTNDGHLIVNELAPRPHNSGHWTIEGSPTSQFDQQARILAGWSIGDTYSNTPACMGNLLGDVWSGGEPAWAEALAVDPSLKLHLYGKTTPKPGRKMGHVTVTDADPRQALARVQAARRTLMSGSQKPPCPPPASHQA
ncbi:MAG: 5-(carboxyamino)imidazole ribonucleotide synthase [Planctomycetota bacterium]|nr:5-(carboxyamino)imidazole ribonucleotide synthase [Planctomycetota bacterium]